MHDADELWVPQAVLDIWGAGSSDFFAVGSGGMIRKWNGTSWTDQTSGITDQIEGVWGWAANDVVAVSQAGHVLRYDGTSWTQIASPAPGLALFSVWGPSRSDFFVGGSDGAVFHYDGAHWAPVAAGATTSVISIGGAGDKIFVFEQQRSTFHRFVRTTTW